MNKVLSQALKKAVSEYSPNINEVTKDKRPDLFSLNNETELFQNDKGIIIKILPVVFLFMFFFNFIIYNIILYFFLF